MKTRAIHDLSALDALQDRWRYVYMSDTNATVFQSWGWLRGWLGATEDPWTVLVVEREAEPRPVGFFAFYTKASNSRIWGLEDAEVHLAGDPLTDYSGILCLAEYEKPVVSALGDYISANLRSCRFMLREIADPRLLKMVGDFDRRRHSVQEKRRTPCPRVELPDSWERFLGSSIPSGFAKTLKRKLTKSARMGCVVTDGNDAVIDDHIETFLDMYEARWGTLGPARRRQFQVTLISCHHEGVLETKMLMYEQRTVAIQVCLLDERNRVYHFYNGGRHPGYDHLSPGVVLHGHCIREAIEKGFVVYDFLRGAESYKYSYGARDVFNRNFVVEPNAWGYRLRRQTRGFLRSARKTLRGLRGGGRGKS